MLNTEPDSEVGSVTDTEEIVVNVEAEIDAGEIAEDNPNKTGETEAPIKPVEVQEGKEDVNVNRNIPRFRDEDITNIEVYHKNRPLDSLGRVTATNAVLGAEIMPEKERGSIEHHEPTGWTQARYANINSGGWLYNHSLLIGPPALECWWILCSDCIVNKNCAIKSGNVVPISH